MEIERAEQAQSDYDREKQLKEFDEARGGVKGLLDSGVCEVPRMFIHPPKNLEKSGPIVPSSVPDNHDLQIPLVDLKDLDSGGRSEIVEQIGKAAETWGLFQIVNHGIPIDIMQEVMSGVCGFHEQPKEWKMQWFSLDPQQRVRFYSDGNLRFSKAACWRDSISYHCDDFVMDTEALPQLCRKGIGGYMQCLVGLNETLSKLLSEALGLSSEFLGSMDCMKTATLVCHYYPSCPNPHLTLGAVKHSDPSFLTILLQDNTGGLQVLHQHLWLDVPPIQGALIVNIGDLLQLITNGKFKSVEHRVVVRADGPRISAACFLYPSTATKSKPFGPIKELLSDYNPPRYRETHQVEYYACYKSKLQDGSSSALHHFKL